MQGHGPTQNESEQYEMRELVAGIGAWMFEPRKLFAVAALLAATGILLGYVEFYDRADRELALRRGPPEAVVLQEFNPGLHTGPADEVMIRAEADFDKAMVMTIPGSAPERRAYIVPLFPMSDMGAALVRSGSGEGASALTAQVARRTSVPSADPGPAMGYVLHPLSAGAPAPEDGSALAFEVFGKGRAGTAVALNGTAVEPGEFGLMAAGAFGALGIEMSPGILAVSPYADGRVAALSGGQGHKPYVVLVALAIGLALAALVLSLRRARRDESLVGDYGAEEGFADGEQAGSMAHPKFAPIPSQREIIEAEQRGEETGPSWGPYLAATAGRWLWIALSLLGALVAMLFRAIRNRLSRPEDEAL